MAKTAAPASRGVVVPLAALGVWSLIWKGIALWRAGGDRDLPWFVALFLLNTAGILEIVYLFVVRRRAALAGPR